MEKTGRFSPLFGASSTGKIERPRTPSLDTGKYLNERGTFEVLSTRYSRFRQVRSEKSGLKVTTKKVK